MTDKQYGQILGLALDIGKLLLVSGAEIYRVEDTVSRIVTAYGGCNVQITAVPSHIIAGVTFEDTEYTGTRRVSATNTDMELLDRINALSREICAARPLPGEIRQKIEELLKLPKYGPIANSLFYALTTSAFTMFFGGSPAEALVSALIGGTLVWLIRFITSIGGNKVFVGLMGAAYAAFAAKLGVRLGLGSDADKIIIGVIMVLIPGIELVNSMRDFIAGDIQAGIMHMSEALFLAVIIAMGAAGVFMLAARLGL